MYINFSDVDKNNEALVDKKFEIAIYALDMNFSSTLPILSNFCYDVGIEHGPVVFKDTEIMNNEVVFVVTKFKVKVDRYPELRENVTIRSWISPIEHRHAIRSYLVLDESGNILVRGVCAINAFNLRERAGVDISVNPNISKAKTLNIEPPLTPVFDKLPDVVSPDYESIIDVRYFDCDLYQHVTSGKYLLWCIENMPVEFLKKHRLCEAEINFKRESSLGEKLIVRTCATSEKNTFLHSITSEDGSKDLIRMKSVWRSS